MMLAYAINSLDSLACVPAYTIASLPHYIASLCRLSIINILIFNFFIGLY